MPHAIDHPHLSTTGCHLLCPSLALVLLLLLSGCKDERSGFTEPDLPAAASEVLDERTLGAVKPPRDLNLTLEIGVPDELPTYFTDDGALVDAVRAVGGRVQIGFKRPDVPPLVDRIEGTSGARRALVHPISAPEIVDGRSIVEQFDGDILDTFSTIPGVVARVLPETAPVLREHPLVDYVEPDLTGWPGGSGASISQVIPNNIAQINAPDAWPHSAGEGVRVVILDTGIAGWPNWHADLPPAPTCLYPSSLGTCADNPASGFFGHGISVAGVLMARDNSIDVIGVAPAVHFNWIMIRVCAPGCDASWVALGLDWVAENVSKHVVNMSFHNFYSAQVATAAAAAEQAGNLLVAIAGNVAQGWTTVTYPGAYPQVIAVSGVTSGDEGHPGSATGPEVELSAPFEVLTLGPTSGTTSTSGTSFAAPAVAGTGALIWAQNPSWSHSQVRQHLRWTAEDLGPPGQDPTFGHGRVDAEAAVTMAPQLFASIDGPGWIGEAGTYNWNADHSGGKPPFTYQWAVNYDDLGGGWGNLGTSQSQSLNVHPSDGNFTLRVTVTSADGQSTMPTRYVTNAAACPPPEITC